VKGEAIQFDNAAVEIHYTGTDFRHLYNLVGADVLENSVH
jgi:hypothetical protein